MRGSILIAVLCIAGTTSAVARDGIDGFCAKRWSSDYEMQEHCVGKQSQSHTRMSDLYGRLKTSSSGRNPVLFRKSVDVIERCMGRWASGDAYDWTMVDHCTKKQLGAALRLAERAEQGRKPEPTVDGYFVVVGAFSSLTNADRLATHLNSAVLAYAARVTERRPGDGLHRVVIGQYWPRAQAEVVRDALLASGVVKDAFLSDHPDTLR